MKRRVGMTTTVPIEVILAAGDIPVDLNNVFISQADAFRLVERAEEAGYPRNVCGWIKGIYSTVLERANVDLIVAVTQGDCSNTHALIETLELRGFSIVPFAFPYDSDRDLLRAQIERFMHVFGVDWEQVYGTKKRLERVRRQLAEVDKLTWKEGVVSGYDNHRWLVSSSDFGGDLLRYERELEEVVASAPGSTHVHEGVRLGYIGVPPIFTDFYQYVEHLGGFIVYNEVQRQFSMPNEVQDIIEQYRLYTYPYGIFARLEDIRREVSRRNVEGIIHYAQCFCFRQIEDMIIREKLDLPVLTLEGDRPQRLDARTRLRLAAFIEMLASSR